MDNLNKIEKVAINMAEFASVMSIGRNKAFELIRQPGFPAVRVGRRVIIPVTALKSWLEKQTADGCRL